MVEKKDKNVYTKNDIALKLAEKFELAKSTATKHVDAMFDILASMIKDSNVGDEVKLGNIGVITTRMTKAGKRRNPKTQQIVDVASKRVAKFRVLPKYRASLNEK
jgi:DNA-binding protein HU-beta